MPQWELPMKLLGELVLVLAIGLGWLILLARLVQGHVEGAWRYLAWSVAACPRRQPVTLIPDRDGVAARGVLRVRLRQLRSPPTPMLSRAPSACASALWGSLQVAPSLPRLRPNSACSRPLLGRSIQTFTCKGDVMLTMLIYSSNSGQCARSAKRCTACNAPCSPTTRRPKAQTKI